MIVLNKQGGELVAVLRGANAPMLQRTIVEELAKEKLVLSNGGVRKVVSCETHVFFFFFFLNKQIYFELLLMIIMFGLRWENMFYSCPYLLWQIIIDVLQIDEDILSCHFS